LALAQVFLGLKKFEEKSFSRVDDVTNIDCLTTILFLDKELYLGAKLHNKSFHVNIYV